MRRLALLSPLLFAACIDRGVTKLEPEPENIENLEFDVELNPNLDLWFVIDNSRSMRNEQEALTANFPRRIEVLETLPTGLPDIHIGVISTDVGAGNACPVSSPRPGILRNTPMITGCAPPSDRYISDVGGARNYTDSLAETFSCIATLGTNGCGYEQPLESIRRALDPSTLENDGFLRPDSLLAVVILSDEDDCSAFDTDLFESATPDGIDGDFRCFEQGIECEGVPADQVGTRENCIPRDDSPYITPIDELVGDLREVRPQSSKLLVAGILGDAEPFRVGLNDMNDLDVLTSCQPDAGNPEGAYPPTRIDAYLNGFSNPIRGRICDADLTPAIVAIGSEIVDRIYGGCVRGALADRDNPDCSVTEVQHPQTTDEVSTILPRCDTADGEAAGNKPCWTLDVDPVCSAGEHLRITTHYPSESRDPDTIIQAQCRLAPGA